jgi:hypothetical protein
VEGLRVGSGVWMRKGRKTKWMYAWFSKDTPFKGFTEDGRTCIMTIRAGTLCKLEELRDEKK